METNRYGNYGVARDHMTTTEKLRDPVRAPYFDLPLLVNGDLYWFSTEIDREEFKNTYRGLALGWGRTPDGTII